MDAIAFRCPLLSIWVRGVLVVTGQVGGVGLY
jgi:hypothetical protein